MNKTLDYYLALPYTIEIIPDEEDGGYVARIRELSGCLTQADTWEELLEMIADAKQLWLESALEHGDLIPEPLGVFS
ncbi:MAG: type II toxin-antitoxin system HicB family antitoxin [Chitinophagaceae bacterium]|nr:type II toxin-antitoxin system HicB family antitoxin [Anaerolineae bacterium]